MKSLIVDTDYMNEEVTALNNSANTETSVYTPSSYEAASVNSFSEVVGLSSLNTKISNYVNTVNSSVTAAQNSIGELINKSSNFLSNITEADGFPLEPSELSNILAKSLEGLTPPPSEDTPEYPLNDPSKPDRKYFGDGYLGSINLGKFSYDPDKKSVSVTTDIDGNPVNFGAPQGGTQIVTTETDENGNEVKKTYTVVTSYNDGKHPDLYGPECGYVRIYDSNGTLVRYFKTDKPSHLGGAVYQNGNLILADGDGLTCYNFNQIMSPEYAQTNGNTLYRTTGNHVRTEGTELNSEGKASFVSLDSQGRLVVGQFHTKNGSFSKNDELVHKNSSDLIFYNVVNGSFVPVTDENGNLVTTRVQAIGGRTNSNGSVSGFTELQGMSVTPNLFGQDMTLFTSSYYANSSNGPSHLFIADHGTNSRYTYKKDGTSDMIADIELPPAVEQIYRMADGNYAIVFEGKNPRIVFVSEDFIYTKLKYKDVNGYKKWKKTDKSETGVLVNGELYIGSLAKPLDKLTRLESEVTELKTNLENASTSLGGAMEVSQTGDMQDNITTVSNQIKVLSDAITDIKSKIIMVIENHRKADEEI